MVHKPLIVHGLQVLTWIFWPSPQRIYKWYTAISSYQFSLLYQMSKHAANLTGNVYIFHRNTLLHLQHSVVTIIIQQVLTIPIIWNCSTLQH